MQSIKDADLVKATWRSLLRELSAPGEYRLREACHRLGLYEDPWVRTIGQVRAIVGSSDDVLRLTTGTRDDRPVLVWSVQANLQHNVVEALLAYALRLRGVEPRIFLCDELLPACEARNALSYPDGAVDAETTRRICDRCFFHARLIFGEFRLPHTRLGAFATPDAHRSARERIAPLSRGEIFDLEYKGLHLGTIIKSSVIRFFLSLSLPEDRRTDEVIRAYGVSAVLMAEIAERVLEQVRPRSVLTSHGLYISWGVMTEMAKRKGIPVAVFWLGKRKSTLNVDSGEPWVKALAVEPVSEWDHLALSDEQRMRVEEFLFGRLTGREDRLIYYKDAGLEEVQITRELRLDAEKPTLGLFPNVLWDSEVFYRNIAFPDVLTWIWDTIAFFAQHPEKQLVIRAHPGETVLPGLLMQKISEAVAERFPTLPPNVRIVPSESPITSYGLASFISAAAVHASQFGLELTVRGTPVIVTGAAPYRGKGFTYDVDSRPEYLALLGRLGELPNLSSEQTERAWKFAYHMYFRRQVPFRYLEPGPHITVAKIHLASLQDLRPHADPALDLIASAARDGTRALWDGPPERRAPERAGRSRGTA